MARDTFDDAERCERSHLPAVSVRELEYRLGAYPFRVALLFADGKEREYIADDGLFMIGQEVENADDKNKGYGKRYKGPR